jgi:RecB family exonuclease
MIKLSASSIGTYEKCPKQYHYRYIEKPDVPKKDWSFLEFGTCAHRVLELFHEDLIKNVREPSEYPIVMRKCFKLALKEAKTEVFKDELPFLQEIIQDYLNVIKRDGLPPVIFNELQFKFDIGGYLVRGFIDRVDKIGPGEYHVVDYKTTKNPKYLTDFQLILYALAVREKYPDAKLVHGSYILLKHKSRTKDWTFTEEDYQRTIDRVISAGHNIDTDDVWEKKPTFLCNWCDFKSVCQDNWTNDD